MKIGTCKGAVVLAIYSIPCKLMSTQSQENVVGVHNQAYKQMPQSHCPFRKGIVHRYSASVWMLQSGEGGQFCCGSDLPPEEVSEPQLRRDGICVNG